MYKKIRKVKKDEEAGVNSVRIVVFNAWKKSSPKWLVDNPNALWLPEDDDS